MNNFSYHISQVDDNKPTQLSLEPQSSRWPIWSEMLFSHSFAGLVPRWKLGLQVRVAVALAGAACCAAVFIVCTMMPIFSSVWVTFVAHSQNNPI
jgi:hypothetical protein